MSMSIFICCNPTCSVQACLPTEGYRVKHMPGLFLLHGDVVASLHHCHHVQNTKHSHLSPIRSVCPMNQLFYPNTKVHKTQHCARVLNLVASRHHIVYINASSQKGKPYRISVLLQHLIDSGCHMQLPGFVVPGKHLWRCRN